MKLIDMALVAGLFFAVGWIAAGMKYSVPKTCPVINGNVHLAMEVNTSGGYKCVYQQEVVGVVNKKVNRS